MTEAAVIRECPIFLTGFMGVGKSVVGVSLAAKLGWDYLDTDELIVRQAGRSIPKIFATLGEAGFRKFESEAVFAASLRHRVVVSLGGGALMNRQCLSQVERAGSLICLDASGDCLQNRLAGSTARPLLAGLSPAELGDKIRALQQEREPVYARALFRVDTQGFRPDDVADAVIRLLFNEAGVRGVRSVAHQLPEAKEGP